MGTLAMPTFSGGSTLNPTGTNGTGGTTQPWGVPSSPTFGSSASAPLNFAGSDKPVSMLSYPTGSPGNYGYGSSGNPNPVGTATSPITNPSVPSMTPGGTAQPLTGFTAPLSSQFGATGVADQTFLNSDGGYNSALTQQAVQAQQQQMQLQANQNYGNLESGLGAAGINPSSSAAALESSNFWSNTTTAENAMTSQEYMSMWESSMANETGLLSSLSGPAGSYQQNYYNQNNETAMDWLSLSLEGAGAAAPLLFGNQNNQNN